MTTRRREIAVRIPCSLTRRAVEESLVEHGYRGQSVSDIGMWFHAHRTGLAILTHTSCDLTEEIRHLTTTTPEAHIVALSDKDAPGRGDLLNAGARAILDRTSANDTLGSTIRLVEEGYIVAPNSLLAPLSLSPQRSDSAITLSAEEHHVLERLAAGDAVTNIATDLGRSRRSMHRWLLTNLFDTLGVTNRDCALVVATRAGLVR